MILTGKSLENRRVRLLPRRNDCVLSFLGCEICRIEENLEIENLKMIIWSPSLSSRTCSLKVLPFWAMLRFHWFFPYISFIRPLDFHYNNDRRKSGGTLRQKETKRREEKAIPKWSQSESQSKIHNSLKVA